AAIGGIPLALGMPEGEYILAISVLAIIITAPLGAFGIKYFTPKFLNKGRVDPTRINVREKYTFLVAMNRSRLARAALQEAARLARQVDGELLILNIHQKNEPSFTQQELQEELKFAQDIEHEIIFMISEEPAQKILDIAEAHAVDYIYLGKYGETGEKFKDKTSSILVGEVAKQVSRRASVPVILIESLDYVNS
ncbi:MAG: universal stress protein, partial [Bacillota bacterium]